MELGTKVKTPAKYLIDTEITEMKKRMAESIPKTPQEMEERMREIEDAMKNLNQTDSIQQENNKQNNK